MSIAEMIVSCGYRCQFPMLVKTQNQNIVKNGIYMYNKSKIVQNIILVCIYKVYNIKLTALNEERHLQWRFVTDEM